MLQADFFQTTFYGTCVQGQKTIFIWLILSHAMQVVIQLKKLWIDLQLFYKTVWIGQYFYTTGLIEQQKSLILRNAAIYHLIQIYLQDNKQSSPSSHWEIQPLVGEILIAPMFFSAFCIGQAMFPRSAIEIRIIIKNFPPPKFLYK